MNTKHTPGPWINRHWDNRGSIAIGAVAFQSAGVHNPVLAHVQAPLHWCGKRDDGTPCWPGCNEASVEECEANARLIAAAPTLYAQLLAIRDALRLARKAMGCLSDHCDGTCHFCANIRRAEAAIALIDGDGPKAQ